MRSVLTDAGASSAQLVQLNCSLQQQVGQSPQRSSEKSRREPQRDV
jgi:hypothetical protein